MPEPDATAAPAFVLVRPQMGENVGAAARAMWNFGLDRMRLVAPRDGWPNPRAVAMASGAGRVLDAAAVHDATAAAVADCERVYATTARGRDLTKRVLTPEAAMAEIRSLALEGRRAAVLFGPERSGLENEDVALANAVVTVPTNPSFPLAQPRPGGAADGLRMGPRQSGAGGARDGPVGRGQPGGGRGAGPPLGGAA